MSHELWFAEGFTQYYGDLLLVRAEFTPIEVFSLLGEGQYVFMSPWLDGRSQSRN